MPYKILTTVYNNEEVPELIFYTRCNRASFLQVYKLDIRKINSIVLSYDCFDDKVLLIDYNREPDQVFLNYESFELSEDDALNIIKEVEDKMLEEICAEEDF